MDLELNFGTLTFLHKHIVDAYFNACLTVVVQFIVHSFTQISQAVVYSLIHLFSCRACKGKAAMDLVTTEEMKELLSSPIIKETNPVTNGTINQQALDSGIHSDT